MAGDPATPSTVTGFEVVRKGYEPGQVDGHLRRLDADVRILTTDRDAALDQAAQLARELDDSRARADRLRAQVRTLVSPQQSVQGMSERMRSMLRLAEDEVAEMLVRAETEVNKRVREAEQKANQLLADARAEVETVRRTARTEALAAEDEGEKHRAQLDAERLESRQAITAAHAEAERERARLSAAHEAEHEAANAALAAATVAAEQDRARAWAESEARRAQVEEDFTVAMNQRRMEALSALTAEQLATRQRTEEMRESAAAGAQAVVEEAQARAGRIVADGERRIVELTALRGRIVEQLGGTRAVLERSLGDLWPLPGEGTGPAVVDVGPAVDGTTGADPAAAESTTAPVPAAPVPAAAAGGPDPSPPGNGAPRPQPTRRAVRPAEASSGRL